MVPDAANPSNYQFDPLASAPIRSVVFVPRCTLRPVDVLTPPYLQLHRTGHRADLGIVVLVDPGPEGPRANGILGTQTKTQSHSIARRERIKVKDGLGRGEAELLQSTALLRDALLLIRLQIFTKQVESGRNAEIDHDHVGRFGKIVLDGSRGGCDVILREMGPIVGYVDGQRLAGRLF